ncbi:class I SAM-dependent methyltransferase [Mesorhizobium sp.]|uniref:class I SAM-dependent methyltransferase n=1 Tax=Mesorhizobium sp. TaxID=1871066 RepID=UPI000FE2AC34|nr:class I SAM-dependent methyltransferase [Mesorhizobium sp.]RWP69448.1 MAG: class I SAM-dependent methyltransferase [Mesorhizobium sp.]RWQ14435.1 MAG: class I SAM-dependent methyltransferase [Mesorhizobium sp.]
MGREAVSVYYDRPNSRLVYVGRPADEGFWDDHWSNDEAAKAVRRKDRFVVKETAARLPKGAKVIDAGCGLAQTVFGLHHSGFDAYGIDYAPRTVELVNSIAPELKVSLGDVRDLRQFSDEFFDGCWSLGVIEHFFDGYDQILAEMYRVLRPGGYAFVTVPSMSPLRRLKAKMGSYPSIDGRDLTGFYQFILSPGSIVQGFERHGFRLISSKPRGGFKGMKDEAGFLRAPLQVLYDMKQPFARMIRAGVDRVISPLSFHTRLYVFQKP